MTIYKHELRLGRMSLVIWTSAIAALIAVCVLIFPDMAGEMESVTDMFSSMGSFSAAFGMDRINFGEFLGFYSVECGNVIGIGGALFAALISISVLAKEEKEHTVEFLLTHPISRRRVVTEKLCSVATQLLVSNIIIFVVSVASMLVIGEEPEWKIVILLHLAYLIMEMEIAAICFGISAFISRSGVGIGLGTAAILYFLNLIANITDGASFLKYITPFSYTDGADIIVEEAINISYLIPGICYAAVAIAAAYIKYCKKDVH